MLAQQLELQLKLLGYDESNYARSGRLTDSPKHPGSSHGRWRRDMDL